MFAKNPNFNNNYEDIIMSKVDEIQILDDIELEDIVGGNKKKKAKKKVTKKKAKRRVYATSTGGATVLVPSNAVENGNGLTLQKS